MFLTIIIPNKRLRRKVRTYIKRFYFKGIFKFSPNKELINFNERVVRTNSVLMIEINSFHGEVLPGFAKYLLDLGYNVDLLITEEVYNEQPFKLFKDERINIFKLGFPDIEKIQKEKFNEYEFIFMSSSSKFSRPSPVYGAYSSMKRFLQDTPQGKNPTIFVYHDIEEVNKNSHKNNELKVITLGNIKGGKMVNPHYFGDVKITDKNDKTVFLTAGYINPKAKNHDLLLKAIKDLSDKNLNFEVVVIGGGDLKNIPEEAKNYIKFKGRLNFPDMYKELESADFFLPLLDPNNEAHERYITTGVTGSSQLIYGFLKPTIIHGKFSNFYGYNDKNSIIYYDDFSNKMSEAIQMKQSEYKEKQDNLKKLSNKIYEESLNNLRDLININ